MNTLRQIVLGALIVASLARGAPALAAKVSPGKHLTPPGRSARSYQQFMGKQFLLRRIFRPFLIQ